MTTETWELAEEEEFQETWEIDESFDPTFELVRPLKEGGKDLVRSAAWENKAWADKYQKDMAEMYSELKAEGTYSRSELEEIKRVFSELHDPFVNQRKPHEKSWHEKVIESETIKPDKAYLESRKHKSGFVRYGEDFVQMIPQALAQIVTTLIGGPASGMFFMGTQIAGGQYEKLIKEGVEPARAFKSSIAAGIMEAPLEAFGLGKALRFFKPGRTVTKVIKDVGSAMVAEFITEWFQKYPELITEVWAKTPGESIDQRFKKVIEGFWQATKEGWYEGSLAMWFGGLTSAGKMYADSKAQQSEDEQVKQIYESLPAQEKTAIDVKVGNMVEQGVSEEDALNESVKSHVHEKNINQNELIEKIKHIDEMVDIDTVVETVKRRIDLQKPIESESREQFFDSMKKRYSDEEVETQQDLFDGVARSWAERNGKSPEEFYTDVIGGFETGTAEQFQSAVMQAAKGAVDIDTILSAPDVVQILVDSAKNTRQITQFGYELGIKALDNDSLQVSMSEARETLNEEYEEAHKDNDHQKMLDLAAAKQSFREGLEIIDAIKNKTQNSAKTIAKKWLKGEIEFDEKLLYNELVQAYNKRKQEALGSEQLRKREKKRIEKEAPRDAEYQDSNEFSRKAVEEKSQEVKPQFVETDPSSFNKALDNTTRPDFLYRYSDEELSNFKTFTTEDGTVGYALTPENDVVNVFNNSEQRGAGAEAVIAAIVNGGETLDCYDGFLAEYYERFGFKEVKRDAWNDEYAPEKWDYDKFGEPDVVYMRYEGGTRNADDIRRHYESSRLQRKTTGDRRRTADPDRLDRKESTEKRLGLGEKEPGTSETLLGGSSKPRSVDEDDDILYQDSAPPRGAIENLHKNIPKIIHAFESADVSTPIHELGHIITDLLYQQKHADYYTLAEFAGVDPDRAEIGLSAWSKSEREKSAIAFEAYCMEGKAPTSRLQDVFKKMKEWLIDIYQSIQNLDIQLNDSVRSIFDRWVSTEIERQADPFADINEWIKAGDLEIDEQSKINEHEIRGIDPASVHEYDQIVVEARKRVLGSIAQKRKKDEKKLKAAFLKEAIDSIQNDGFYLMMDDLKASGGLKLSDLYDLYDKDHIRDLISRMPGLISENGLNADFFATQYNYYNTDELIQDILNHPTKKEAIQRYNDDLWMEYERGLDYENAESYQEIIDEEINILNQMLGKKKSKARKDLKKTIREQTGQIKDEDYRKLVQDFKHDEILARKAFREGKKEGALEKTLKLREQQRERVRKIRGNIKEQRKKTIIDNRMNRYMRSKSIPPEYREQITHFLQEYYYVPPSFQVTPEKNLEAFLEQRYENNEWTVDTIKDLLTMRPVQMRNIKGFRKPLTPDERQIVADIADMLAHMGRTEGKLIKAEKERELRSTIGEMTKRGYEVHGSAGISEDIETPSQRKMGWWQSMSQGSKEFLAQLRKAEFLFQWLDGWKDDGPNYQIFQWIKKAEDHEFKLGEDVWKKLRTAFKGFNRKWAFEKIRLPWMKKPLTKEEVVMVALNSGNEGNLKALRAGYGWEDQQIQEIVNTLNEDERQLVINIWNIIDELYPELNTVHKDLTGVDLKKVGGNYFPLIFDRELSFLVAKHASEKDMLDHSASAYTRPKVEAGHMKARKGGKLPPLLKFSTIAKHVTDVVHNISHQIPIRNAQQIIADKVYRHMVEGTIGKENYLQLMPWLKYVARPKPEPTCNLEKILGRIRRGTTVVALGAKFSVAAKQALSLTQTIKEVGLGRTLRAMSRFYAHPRKTAEFIKENSAMIRNRKRQWDRELAQFAREFDPTHRPGLETAREAFFGMIGFMDAVATMPTWLAGYQEGMDRYNNNQDKAVDHADKLVRQTQPAASPKDLAGIQRGGELKKLFTMFYTFFSVFQNQMMKTAQMYRLGNINTLQAMKAYWWILIFPSILGGIINRRRLPEDDEWWKDLVSYGTGGLPFVRDIVSGMIKDYGYTMSPAVGFGEEIKRLNKAIWAEEKELGKIIKPATKVIGYWWGLPSNQLIITVDGMIDLMTGETEDFSRLFFSEQKRSRRR